MTYCAFGFGVRKELSVITKTAQSPNQCKRWELRDFCTSPRCTCISGSSFLEVQNIERRIFKIKHTDLQMHFTANCADINPPPPQKRKHVLYFVLDIQMKLLHLFLENSAAFVNHTHAFLHLDKTSKFLYG